MPEPLSLARVQVAALYSCTWLPLVAPVSFHRCTHRTEPHRSLSIIDHVSTVEWSASKVRSTQPVCMLSCIQCIHLPPPAPCLNNLSTGRPLPPHATATTWMIKYGHCDASYAHEQLRPLFGELLLRNQALVEHSFELSDHCDRRLRR